MALAIDIIASMAAFPHNIVHPGRVQSWQSRDELVLYGLFSGLGGSGRGTPLLVVGWSGEGSYQFDLVAPSWSLGGDSRRMQMPSLRGMIWDVPPGYTGLCLPML